MGRVPAMFTTVVVSLLVLAGCGGGAPSKADEAAIGKTALNGSQMKIDSSVELCIGKSLVDDLGLEKARQAVAQTDPRKLPEVQRHAAVVAFDRCVPSSAFAKTFVGQLPKGTSDEELEACLTEQFRGKVGSVAAAVSVPNSDPATTKRFDNCPTHDLAVQVLRTGLTGGGVPAAVVACVSGQMSDLKLSEVLTRSPTLETRVEALTKRCSGK
jgi:hypothetical protein